MPPTIPPADVAARAGQGGLLLDVRTPVEYREVHAQGTVNHPLDGLDPLALPADGPVYVFCQGGGRAAKAADRLVAAGRTDVHVVEGGTRAWVAAGLPVNRGKKAVSLERQVRIAAGVLLLLGVVLTVAVHPLFILQNVFIACGLVFAGVTDTCTMGMLLARMPWNRVAAKPGEACAVAR